MSETIVSSHKKIAYHKANSVHESIPAWSNMDAHYRDIKYMHTNTEVIQYNGRRYCEVIFFDFHLTTDTIPRNYIYTHMKGKIFFALLVSAIVSLSLWAGLWSAT